MRLSSSLELCAPEGAHRWGFHAYRSDLTVPNATQDGLRRQNEYRGRLGGMLGGEQDKGQVVAT